MADYIDREQALYELCNNSIHVFAEDGHQSFVGDFLSVLLGIPAADVVEVVRCKDCTYFAEAKVNQNGFLICPASGMEITEMDYCSYGERKAGNHG